MNNPIKNQIKIDFGKKTTPIIVFAKEYDNKSRYLNIYPLSNGQEYEIEDGVTARFRLTKPDGKSIFNNTTIEDGIIIAELTQQILAVNGMVKAEIALYKDDAVLSSQVFYIQVEKAAYNPDKVESSDEFNALTAALAEVESAAEKAAAIASEIANEAADNANSAAEGAEKVNISAVQTATGATISVTDRAGVVTTVHIDTLTAVNTWEDIKNAVRLGLGEKLFPVGYEFTTEDSVTGAVITWVVRGHNHHTAANNKLEYTMTLEAKYVYSNSAGTYLVLQFDAPEAMYYAETGLSAGTYNFIWNYEWDTVKGGSFQFTLAKPVPEGGQLRLGTNEIHTALTDCKITTYAAVGDADFIENNVAVTEGADGINLGRIDLLSSTDKNLNCAQRILWGSNNYAQSAARQWLNSDAAAGAVWTPTNKFDCAPSWAASKAGFMKGLPADFLAAVQPAAIPCRTNSVFEVNSLDGTEHTVNKVYELKDKFFLLSRPEIYGTWDSSSYKDGGLLEYYEGFTDTERIKYDAAGSARNCWLRSPYPGYAYIERGVSTSGALYSDFAYYSLGVAPACIIA